VLGVLAGIMGTIQAAEAVKYLLGIGDLLTNRLLVFDALKMRFREVAFKRNPACALCGSSPSITDLHDEAPAVCNCANGRCDGVTP
jgi:adenylyltransferase/sulfurtransferase